MIDAIPVGAMLASVRERSPLIHNITNYVVMNFTANVLLAVGASPVMAHAEEEVEEMAAMAGALVVNLGTLSLPWIKSMERAMREARRRGIPVVLDPVGAGATRLRTETARRFVKDFGPTMVRGNASEILAIASDSSPKTKGVDSAKDSRDAVAAATALARSEKCVVCVSGPIDYVTDGERTLLVRNGHEWMTKVTGMGCSATALIAAVSAVHPQSLTAAAGAMALIGIGGELAAQGAPGLGSMQIKFIDYISGLRPELADALARIEEAAK